MNLQYDFMKAEMNRVCELAAALDRESAAWHHAKQISRAECEAFLQGSNGHTADSLAKESDVMQLRVWVAELIQTGVKEPSGWVFDPVAAKRAVLEYPIAIEVRADWCKPYDVGAMQEIVEFRLAMGAAVWIGGRFSLDGKASGVFVGYEQGDGRIQTLNLNEEEYDALLSFCRQFDYGVAKDR